jgi:hypothetical protein
MDVRQEARDRFDRIMRVPDRIVEVVGGIAAPASLVLLVLPIIAGSGVTDADVRLWFQIALSGAAVFAMYFATRFVAALIFAALVIRRRDRINASDADRRAGTRDAQAQTVHQLAAGR